MNTFSDKLVFRSIEERDINDILPIELEAYPEPWTRAMFQQEVESPLSCFHVALFNEVLVGYGGFWRALDEAHITSVSIHKDYRRRGFGRQLMAFLLDLAAEEGLVRATLEVRPSNIRAQNLYVSVGFEQVGRRKRYYAKTNEDAIIMALDLRDGSRVSGFGARD